MVLQVRSTKHNLFFFTINYYFIFRSFTVKTGTWVIKVGKFISVSEKAHQRPKLREFIFVFNLNHLDNI